MRPSILKQIANRFFANPISAANANQLPPRSDGESMQIKIPVQIRNIFAAQKKKWYPPRADLNILKQSVIDLRDAQYIWNNFFNINTLRYEDKIISYKGKGRFDYYYEMIDRDGRLAGLIETRIDDVAGLTWDVKAASDDDSDKELAVFAKWAIKRIKHFDDDLADILSACVTGFSVSEVVWNDANYEGVSVLAPERILAIPPDAFRFGDERELRLLETGSYPGTDTREWPMKLIRYSFRPRNENPYGVSLLRACYWPWFFKHQAIGFWLRAAEVGAEVTPVFRYDERTSEAEAEEMAKAAQQFLKAKYIVCPDKCTIEFPSIKVDPEMASVLVKNLDDEMRFRIEGSELASGTATGGTRALGEVHEQPKQKRIEHDAKSLETVLNETLIPWVIELNFGEQPAYPYFKLNYETEEDQGIVRENIKTAVDYGVPLSVNYIAERLNLKLAQEGEQVAVKVQIQSPFGAPGTNPLAFSAGDRPKKVLMAANAVTIKQEMMNLENAAIEGGKKVVADIRKQSEDWLSTFDNLDTAYDAEFDPDLTRLTDYIAQARFLSKLYGMFRVYGIPRIAEVLGTRKASIKAGNEWTPIPFDEAINRFKKRKVVTKKQFDMLTDAEKNNAITATGITKETIKTVVKSALLTAIEEGASFGQVKKQIADVAMSPMHAENIFRTNVQSAYNSGHAEAMFDERLKDDIPGFQFVAIPDDRICEICEPLDGTVYERAEMESLSIVPPLHYMCRCTIVPVFADEYEGPTENRPDINNLEGFGSWQPSL